MNTVNDREIWVDHTKVFACPLVVLGHFFQSLVKAGIIDHSPLYLWFNTSIYYFHVPLFLYAPDTFIRNTAKLFPHTVGETSSGKRPSISEFITLYSL